MRHQLKTYPEYFEAVLDRKKKFEVRKNDRNFQVGDILVLQEWDPEEKDYTGSAFAVKVIYILDDPQFVKEGYVILGMDL